MAPCITALQVLTQICAHATRYLSSSICHSAITSCSLHQCSSKNSSVLSSHLHSHLSLPKNILPILFHFPASSSYPANHGYRFNTPPGPNTLVICAPIFFFILCLFFDQCCWVIHQTSDCQTPTKKQSYQYPARIS